MQGCKIKQNEAKATGMRLIQKVQLICVGKENQYVQVRKPVECQKQHCKIGLKCKNRGKHWWDMEEKFGLESKKKNNYQIALKLRVMWVSVPHYTKLKKL